MACSHRRRRSFRDVHDFFMDVALSTAGHARSWPILAYSGLFWSILAYLAYSGLFSLEAQLEPWRLRFSPGGSDSALEAQIEPWRPKSMYKHETNANLGFQKHVFYRV